MKWRITGRIVLVVHPLIVREVFAAFTPTEEGHHTIPESKDQDLIALW